MAQNSTLTVKWLLKRRKWRPLRRAFDIWGRHLVWSRNDTWRPEGDEEQNEGRPITSRHTAVKKFGEEESYLKNALCLYYLTSRFTWLNFAFFTKDYLRSNCTETFLLFHSVWKSFEKSHFMKLSERSELKLKYFSIFDKWPKAKSPKKWPKVA